MERAGLRSTIAVAALAALFAGLALAAIAVAARPATRAERAEITRLIHHDHSGDITHPGRVHVGRIVVSTKAPWASAVLAMRIPGEPGPDTAAALFKRHDAHYRLVGIGSDEVGCGLISNAIAEELEISGCR